MLCKIPYTRPEERISASKELVTTDIPVDPEYCLKQKALPPKLDKQI